MITVGADREMFFILREKAVPVYSSYRSVSLRINLWCPEEQQEEHHNRYK
jgi:hypothetical protein